MNATNKYYFEAPLSARTVAAGLRLQTLTRAPSRVEVVLFCAAIRNFHRLHYDDAYTHAQGIRDVIVPGFLMGNWCLEAVSRTLGPGWDIRKLKFRNTGLAYVGDTFIIDGEVSEVSRDASGHVLARCEVSVTSSDEQTVTSAQVEAVKS